MSIQKLTIYERIATVDNLMRVETVNQIKSECSKLTQKKYESRYGCVRKLIH